MPQRTPFSRAWSFLNFKPVAKWSALVAAVGTGILYVGLLFVLFLFADLVVSQGHVPAFADLPDDQIDWFLGRAEELHVSAGNTYFRQGDPADAMFVILEGQLQLRGELGGETVVLTSNPGDVTVSFPFRE